MAGLQTATPRRYGLCQPYAPFGCTLGVPPPAIWSFLLMTKESIMTDTYGHQKESHRVGTHAPHLWFGACFYSFYRFGTDNCPSVRASNQGTPTRTDTVPTPYNPWYTVEHGPLRTHFGTLRARSYGTPTCRQRWTTLSQPLHHRPYTLRASPTTVHY